ncbi:MAG: aminotransferase class I/II-fold pyridoxal phosphate-dependent enzyme [Candidatus Paceibacterota bacterium]
MKSFYNNIKSKLKKSSPRVIQSGQGAYFTIDGKRLLNLCSSHYLGFAMDKRLAAAAQKVLKRWGLGTGYRTLAGTNTLNTQLEKKLAQFKKAQAAIVLPGGYLANMTAIQTILGKEDIVISDALNHASIIDAVRLSGVKNKFIYKHCDVLDLEEKLKQASKLRLSQTPGVEERSGKTPGVKRDGRKDSPGVANKTTRQKPTILIVTDGVFSMDGDLAPLPDIVRLAKKYNALTMVDDAHGEGVLGKGGRGIVDHFGFHGKVDIEVGTLSKAFGVIGGFITGKKVLIDFYKQNARQFIFSSAMTAPDTAALLEAVKILQKSDHLVKKLWDNTKYLKRELVSRGFDIGGSKTPITPIMLGDEKLAVEFANKLFKQGVFASAITYPLVALGTARIRLIPSAAHERRDLDFALKRIERIGKKLRVI